MNKKKRTIIYLILVCSNLFFWKCSFRNRVTPVVTTTSPPVTPTLANPMHTNEILPTVTLSLFRKHYVFNKDGLSIEFDYPNQWPVSTYGDSTRIFFDDPRKPTPDPSIQYIDPFILGDYASLEIDISINLEEDALGSYPVSFVSSRKQLSGYTLLSDFPTIIGGHPARWVKVRVDPERAKSNSDFIEETIFVFPDNSMIVINLSLPESEREGSFGRGFDELIHTIKISLADSN